MNIKDKLYRFYHELMRNDKIYKDNEKNKIDLFPIPEDMLDDDIKFIKENTGITILDKEFLNISGLSICWHFTNDCNEFIYGGFRINGYIEALVQASNFWDVFNSLNRHDPSEEELEF